MNECPHLIGTDVHGVVGEFALRLADYRPLGGFEGVDEGGEGQRDWREEKIRKLRHKMSPLCDGSRLAHTRVSNDKSVQIRVLRARCSDPDFLFEGGGDAGDCGPHPEDSRGVQVGGLFNEGIDPGLQFAGGVAVGGGHELGGPRVSLRDDRVHYAADRLSFAGVVATKGHKSIRVVFTRVTFIPPRRHRGYEVYARRPTGSVPQVRQEVWV